MDTDGVQFAHRVVHGMQGNKFFKIGIVRGKALAAEACALELIVQDETVRLFPPRTNASLEADPTSTCLPLLPVSILTISLRFLLLPTCYARHPSCLQAHLGVDFQLPEQKIIFPAGERMMEVSVVLLDTSVSLKSDTDHSWRPIREATLKLAPAKDAYESELNVLGDVTACSIKIVHDDRWPHDNGDGSHSGSDAAATAFWVYVKSILRENAEAELWWALGVLIRAVNASILRVVLNSILLLDVVILKTDLNMAFYVATGNLMIECVVTPPDFPWQPFLCPTLLLTDRYRWSTRHAYAGCWPT